MQRIDPKCTSMLLIECFRMTQAHLDRTVLLPLYRASYPRSITPPYWRNNPFESIKRERYIFYSILRCVFRRETQHEKHLISMHVFRYPSSVKTARFDRRGKEQVEPERVKTTRAITSQWRIIKGLKTRESSDSYCRVNDEWFISFIFIFIQKFNLRVSHKTQALSNFWIM